MTSKGFRMIRVVVLLWHSSWWSRAWANVGVGIDNRVGGLIPRVLWYWREFFLTIRIMALFPQGGQGDEWLVLITCPHWFQQTSRLACLLCWKSKCWFYFGTSHWACSNVVCWLSNDNFVITLIDLHDLSHFGCHQHNNGQSSNKRDDRQRCLSGHAKNL